MGFYSPSQLVQDAVRHGVEVCGIDIYVSDWDAKLEPSNGEQPAVRLGLNLIRGMEHDAAWWVEEARAIRPFKDLHDLGIRAGLDAAQLKLLASANALAGISGNRRQAIWNSAGSVPDCGLLREAHIVED